MKKRSLTAATLLLFMTISASAGTGPAWAWDAGKITNNGSIQIKSTSGGSNFNAVQNPTGAVAKTNQSAVTQPPTVIIQATSGGYSETMPLIGAGLTPPMCPAGYTRVFTQSANGCPASAERVFNAAGSRWSLITMSNPSGGGYRDIGWVADGAPTYSNNGNNVVVSGGSTSCNGGGYTPAYYVQWSASLCSK